MYSIIYHSVVCVVFLLQDAIAMMGHRVVVAVTLPLLGQGIGLGLAQGQGLGQGLAPGLGPRDEHGLSPTSTSTPISAYTTLLPYQGKQREAAELAAMSRARATETSTASGQGLGGGSASRPGLASGSRFCREDKATAIPSSSSSSLLTLRRAYSAMWRNTLLSSQPRFQELPVLPLTATNALKLALALCPEGHTPVFSIPPLLPFSSYPSRPFPFLLPLSSFPTFTSKSIYIILYT